jgi:hypothetical protein
MFPRPAWWQAAEDSADAAGFSCTANICKAQVAQQHMIRRCSTIPNCLVVPARSCIQNTQCLYSCKCNLSECSAPSYSYLHVHKGGLGSTDPVFDRYRRSIPGSSFYTCNRFPCQRRCRRVHTLTSMPCTRFCLAGHHCHLCIFLSLLTRILDRRQGCSPHPLATSRDNSQRVRAHHPAACLRCDTSSSHRSRLLSTFLRNTSALWFHSVHS